MLDKQLIGAIFEHGRGPVVKIILPLKLPSLANARLHWRALDKIKRSQKDAVTAWMRHRQFPPLPVVVTITRIGKRRLDGDNLQAAAKYVRDQIAAIYETDDGSDLFVWRYEQRLGETYAVEIDIEPVT